MSDEGRLPLMDQGDPGRLCCRHCGAPRLRLNRALVCDRCDGRADGLATWQGDAEV